MEEITGRYLDVSGHRLYMDTAGGEGSRPIIFIHTAGQHAIQWRFVLPLFARKDYFCVAPDLPGHGKSLVRNFEPLTSVHAFAEVIWEMIRKMGLEKPVVIGCSIGGDIVLDLAVNHSSQLSGVVACEGAVRTPTLSPGVIQQGLEDSGTPSFGDQGFFMGLSLCGSEADPERVREITFTRRTGDPRVYNSDLKGWITHDIRSRMQEISCPVLIVWGKDDYLMPYELVEETVRGIPGARLAVMEGIGHYPHIEAPDFSKRIETFIDSLE